MPIGLALGAVVVISPLLPVHQYKILTIEGELTRLFCAKGIILDDSRVNDEGRRVGGLALNDQVVAALQAGLPEVAERTVAAVTVEVPSYADAFSGRMGQRIESAVQMALGAFLQLAARSDDSDAGPPLSPALDGAYELGRGEARQGRSMDALLAAYRVGARVAWRELSGTAVDGGLAPLTIARFAELVFAFIDELSAASVSGHADELASSDRQRRRGLDRLGRQLLAGVPLDKLLASAEAVGWQPPDTLTAVLVPSAQMRGVLTRFQPPPAVARLAGPAGGGGSGSPLGAGAGFLPTNPAGPRRAAAW
jgi:hypothetical protein